MRTQELLSALAQGGEVIVTLDNSESGFKLPSCTVELGYHPFSKHVRETIFDAALDLAQELVRWGHMPDAVRIALQAYDRRTETLI